MHAMLHHAKLPKKFWAEALSTTVSLKNRSPHSYIIGRTPYEIFHAKKPNLSHLHVFGCLATVHVPKQQHLKIDAKANVFIGYSDDVKGYRLIDRQTLAVTISRNVIFHEDKFLCDMENVRNIHPTAEDLVSIDYCGGNYQDDEDKTEDNSDQSSVAPVSRELSEKTDNLVQEENTAQVGATYEETFMHQVRSTNDVLIDEYLRSAGYKPSTADTCIYIKQEGERYVLLAIYVDDILIASNNTSMLQKEKVQLSEKFDVVDQGEAHYL